MSHEEDSGGVEGVMSQSHTSSFRPGASDWRAVGAMPADPDGLAPQDAAVPSLADAVHPTDDSFAWRGVYQQHAERLIRLATILVGPDDASDLVVDTVRRVFAHRSSAAGGSAQSLPDLDGYLTRSLVNAAMSHHRSTSRRNRREQRAALSDVVLPIDPANALDVRRALAGLSPQQRAVVFLSYWDDLSIPQVALRLDVSEGTVRRQLARAKSRLREVLQ